MRHLRPALIWLVVTIAIGVTIIAAASSPLLAWRQPVYIIAGFAGIIALCMLLVQPMLAAGLLPGLSLARSRRIHQYLGAALVLAVTLHVGGLWITSPPDVIDALTFTSPTPFSAWGVIAMWAIFGAALLAVFRRRMRLRVVTWRNAHTVLAAVTVLTTILHALLIEGTMEPVSKALFCLIVAVVLAGAIATLRRNRRRS